MKAALLALPCLAAVTGCTTQWPADMPPATYSGTVMNGPRHAPEPDATVIAIRPQEDLSFFPPALFIPYAARNEKIGETHSASNGAFTLKTAGGYATGLVAISRDGWLEGFIDGKLKRDKTDMIVSMDPAEREISYHSVNLSEDDCDGLRLAFGKLVSSYIALDHHALSVDQYLRRGILSPQDGTLLERLKPHLLGEHADISIVYAHCIVRIDSFAKPVRFEPNPRPWKSAALLDIDP